jgi:hypothetical protein
MPVRIIYEVKTEIPRLAESAFGDDPRQGTLAMPRNVVAPLERSRTADHHCASPEIAVIRSTARMPTRSMLRRGPSNSFAAASAKARSAMACKLGTAARSSLSASSYGELALVFLFVYMRLVRVHATRPESAAELDLLKRLDPIFTDHPVYGSRRLQSPPGLSAQKTARFRHAIMVGAVV